ncbi:MAG: class I tRNA ligase family protein, partial [Thermoleophilaceae bacterium]|nr:class I tRNA ligase family protein [Thermoleophilaceae bacterium]
YRHSVALCERCESRIEPLISLQWWCAMDDLKQPALEALRERRVRYHPESQHRFALESLESAPDWNISRQLWWGHQLPVWYCPDGHITVAETDPDACAECGSNELTREEDVLDTWFSSALFPFAALGWPDDTPELRAFYPTDVLSTARDIIFLWVARMVMFGLEFTGRAPFTDVPIHSVIQAPDGRRMSKSLGTGIDPIQEIDEHGADAVRFGLLAMSSTQDVRFSAQRVQQGRDLANKLWNASRLVLLGVSPEARPDPDAVETVEDRWIVSRLERLTESTSVLVDGFELSRATLELYDGFWSELCDWYLELAKPRLYCEDNGAVSAVLLHALERVLALLHPAMPFVTEEVWSFLPGERGLLALAAWPEVDHARVDEEAEARVGRLIEAVTELRRYRDEVGAKASVAIPVRMEAAGYDGLEEQLARLARLTLAPNGDEAVAEVRVPGGAVGILPSDAFDPEEARRRVAARCEKLEAEIDRLERKLANERFTERAPAEVVEAERAKLAEYRAALDAARR